MPADHQEIDLWKLFPVPIEELGSGNTVKGNQKDYERFFTVKETPKRGRKVEYNQEAIEAYRYVSL